MERPRFVATLDGSTAANWPRAAGEICQEGPRGLWLAGEAHHRHRVPHTRCAALLLSTSHASHSSPARGRWTAPPARNWTRTRPRWRTGRFILPKAARATEACAGISSEAGRMPARGWRWAPMAGIVMATRRAWPGPALAWTVYSSVVMLAKPGMVMPGAGGRRCWPRYMAAVLLAVVDASYSPTTSSISTLLDRLLLPSHRDQRGRSPGQQAYQPLQQP